MLPGIASRFEGFDHTPYLASCKAGRSSIVFVNAHLFFGSTKRADLERRTLETIAVAKWTDQRKASGFSFTRNLIAMGDFNMPLSGPGDPIFEVLTQLGLQIPDHSSQIASDSTYDQVAFLSGATRRCLTGRKGLFDYDRVVFPDWREGGVNAKNFKTVPPVLRVGSRANVGGACSLILPLKRIRLRTCCSLSA